MEIFSHNLLREQVNEAEKYLFNCPNPCRRGRKSTACCHTVSYDVELIQFLLILPRRLLCGLTPPQSRLFWRV